MRVHQKAAGPRERGNLELNETIASLIRVRGLVIADSTGHACALQIASGQAHELHYAQPSLNGLRGPSGSWMIKTNSAIASGSRSRTPDKTRHSVQAQRRFGALSRLSLHNRNIVERLSAPPKKRRALVSR
jgi:hypothetical protein